MASPAPVISRLGRASSGCWPTFDVLRSSMLLKGYNKKTRPHGQRQLPTQGLTLICWSKAVWAAEALMSKGHDYRPARAPDPSSPRKRSLPSVHPASRNGPAPLYRRGAYYQHGNWDTCERPHDRALMHSRRSVSVAPPVPSAGAIQVYHPYTKL